MRYIVHTDGGARGNPGPAGIGFVVREGERVIKKVGKCIGETTNNVAEYTALIEALGELKKIIPKGKREETDVEVRMDSELVVKQLNGEYQIKDEPLQLLFMKVWNLRVAEFPHITFSHVPRAENAEADALVNEALDAHGA